MTFQELMDYLTDMSGNLIHSRDWSQGFIFALMRHKIIGKGIFNHVKDMINEM